MPAESSIVTVDGTLSKGLWPVLEESQGDEGPEVLYLSGLPAAKAILDDFVRLLRDTPRVWAVYGTEDPSGITVWTFVDSTDRNDLLPVYEAEWRLLNRYPQVGFDFNTALVPAGSEQFDRGNKVFLFRR